jgi:RNA polymerase sigma factor (sigma-70 family)
MSSSTPDAESAPILDSIDESTLVLARKIIASARARLEWVLRIPELETLLVEGMQELEMPSQRQGIGFRGAIEVLAIEHKFNLVRWTLPRLRRRFPAQYLPRLARDWHLDCPGVTELDESLTQRQWEELSESLGAVLSKEQRRYKRAQAVLFHQHQRIVDLVVRRSVFHVARKDDGRQEGALALLAAIDRIEDSGASFEAYAHQWISRAVRNFLLKERLPVYAPVNLVSKALREKAPGLPGGLLEPPLPLDAPGPDGAPTMQIEDDTAPGPASDAERSDLRDQLRAGLVRLTPKQREVVELRYGLGRHPAMTIQEIARRVGITHQQVSMREKRALESLSGHLSAAAAENIR